MQIVVLFVLNNYLCNKINNIMYNLIQIAYEKKTYTCVFGILGYCCCRS